MGALVTALAEILGLPAVGTADVVFDVADLVLLGLAEGTWQRFEDRLARGLALEATLTVEEAAVRERVRAFRYERRLIAAKELREWLAVRSLVIGDVERHCGRDALIATHGLEGDRDPSIAPVLRAEAICSGELARLASRLVDLVALASTVEPVAPPQAQAAALVTAAQEARAGGIAELDLGARCARIAALEAAEVAAADTVASHWEIERCIGEHGLDWIRVHCVELTLPTEGAGREAVLCARIDQTDLETLASDLGRPLTTATYYLGDVAGHAAPQLASAPIGATVGPFEAEQGWRVVRVEARAEPTVDDPELVSRATAVLTGDARARARAGKVRTIAVL